jgi:HPt (histidine-containing phosphotransfer) domain-containing protein
LSTLDNDHALVNTILGQFLTDIEATIGFMNKAVVAGDAPALYRYIHSIKGSSLNVGALEMAREAATAEASDAKNDLTSLRMISDRITAAFSGTSAAIAHWKSTFSKEPGNENSHR